MGKAIDLTGQRFGKLVVSTRADNKGGMAMWNCSCDCGGTTIVSGKDLRNGKKTACACENKNLEKGGFKNNLKGMRFGRLLVKEDYYNDKVTSHHHWCHCVCDCGKETDVVSTNLTRGVTKSCGCLMRELIAKRNFKDLTGMRFTKLLVTELDHIDDKRGAYWRCKCDCGNEIIVPASGLQEGYIRACTCTNYNFKTDLTGKHFGYWEVISYAGNSRWNCKCNNCGNTKEVLTSSLVSGASKSCGCRTEYAHEDLTGKKFNMLTVDSYSHHSNDGNYYWNCTCDCGNTTIASTKALKSGSKKSCTCLHGIKTAKANSNRFLADRVYPQWFIDELYYEEDKNNLDRLTTTSFVWFKCEVHGKYLQRIGDHIRLSDGTALCGCPQCSNRVGITGSKAENEIKEFIETVTKDNITKEKILDLNDGGNKKEIDIYLKEHNLGIEYNGSVYHATEGAVFDNKSMKYHQQKFLAAKKQGIHLISIFDVDWNTNADKIKMYLKSLLVDNKKVFARKCEIKSVDRKIANEFTDKYHLQGHARLSSINYGLYYNDELLSVMSFGRLRLQKTEEGQFELHRYCVKDGYTIVGGANKLLKAFEREHNPKYLLSFSDNDYFMGGIYYKLGFTNDGQSTPRYYWFLNNEEIKREKCQLKHLKEKCPELLQEAYDNNAGNKEDYVMLKLGACKVYRSGNTRWIKEYKS